MLPDRLLKFATPVQVLDKGYLMLVDVMGDDEAVVQAARVSYASGTTKTSNDRNLIRYLLRSGHTSPFEQAQIKLEVKLPIYVERQWARHRTASWNEMSGRYSIMPDEFHQTKPENWRLQATGNKQGSAGFLEHWPKKFDEAPSADSPGSYLSSKEEQLQQFAREVYEERLSFGIAREQARCVLPVSNYTSKVWTTDLHNLLHFLLLRGERDDHAQEEIRLYSHCIAEIVKAWVPLTWEAFKDYKLESMHLSRMEVQGLQALLRGGGNMNHALDASGLEGRERREFEAKLRVLMA